MKRRTQKIFITLLSLFIAGFAMVNAYTFEVLNWNPFGVLNLKTLIMKPDVNTTGIVIDGASYTIKIDPNHETEDGGIWVDRICDESGVNCKKVSELGIGGGGAIVIDGNVENFCFKKDDTTLLCDNEFLRSLIESWGLGGSINIDGQDKNYCYRSKETNTLYCDNTNLPTGNGSTPGNGKITIIQGSNEREFFLNGTGDKKITLSNGGGTTSGAIAYGSGEYICVKNGNNLDCSKAKLGELKPAKRCTFDGTSINCTEDEPTGGGIIAATASALGGIKIGYSQNGKYYPVQLDRDNKAYVYVPREAGEGGDGGIEIIDKVIGGRCKYGTTSSFSFGDGGGTIKTGIICTESDPSGSSDSLWKEGTNTNGRTFSYIQPKTSSNNLYLKSNIYYDSSLEFWGLQSNSANANRTRQLKLDSAGIRIGESTTTYGYTGVGIGVLGAIGIGTFSDCSSNHLTMFATGNTANGNFEILGNSRLLVGVNNDSYIYFNLGKKIGVNTTASDSTSTLTVNGSIKVGNCNIAGTGCNQNNAGEIRYVEPEGANKGYFIGCVKDTNADSGYRRRILDSSNMSNTNFSNDSSCNSGVPYNLSNYTSLGLPRPGQCSN